MLYSKFKQIFRTELIILSIGFFAFLTGTIYAQNSTELANELELVDEQLVENVPQNSVCGFKLFWIKIKNHLNITI